MRWCINVENAISVFFKWNFIILTELINFLIFKINNKNYYKNIIHTVLNLGLKMIIVKSLLNSLNISADSNSFNFTKFCSISNYLNVQLVLMKYFIYSSFSNSVIN